MQNGHHYQGDVFDIIDDDWDLMVAHPPCTYLANSGVRWLHEKDNRWDQMEKGCEFFKALMNANIPRIAVENPIMHKHAKALGIGDPFQVVQPWMFGENESKAICLWLKGLMPLIPEIDSKPGHIEQKIWAMPQTQQRQKERSRFYKGVAKAMAEQWG